MTSLQRIGGYERSSETEKTVEVSPNGGDLYVAQGSLPYQEMTRQGDGWQVMNTSALAALVVRPSTLSNLTLWNGELAGGKSYVVFRVMAFNLVSTAAEARAGIWLCSHPVNMTAPTADITAIKSTRGKATYAGRAVVDTNATVVDDGWFPWGDGKFDVEPTGVLPGAISTPRIDGAIIIPPQAGLSIQVVAGVVGNTYTCGFHWFEKVLTLPS